VQRCTGAQLYTTAIAFSSLRRAIDDEESGPPQATLDEVIEPPRQASVLPPPTLLFASSTFWPWRTPSRDILSPIAKRLKMRFAAFFSPKTDFRRLASGALFKMELMFASSSRS
jgi:hypothetical protein